MELILLVIGVILGGGVWLILTLLGWTSMIEAKEALDEKTERYRVKRIVKQSELVGCGEVELVADSGEVITLYIAEDNMIYQMVGEGDFLLGYHDEKLGRGLAVPLGELGEKKCGSEDFQEAYRE